MAKSEQQRQKKLAKKRSKELRDRQLKAQRSQALKSVSGQMQWASQFPVFKCCVGQSIFDDTGIGAIFLSRKLNDGRIALIYLLLDRRCLGVKDAGWRICTVGEFEGLLEGMNETNHFVSVEPSYAKKLTDQAIEYAESIGFSPHPEYRRVSPLWGDIDSSECREDFTFGVDGKPYYFAGPMDDAARQTFIFNRLCQTVGEGNFHFTVGGPLDPFDLRDIGFDPSAAMQDDEPADDEDDRYSERHESLSARGERMNKGQVIEGRVVTKE